MRSGRGCSRETRPLLKRADQEPPILYYPSPVGYQAARTLSVRFDATGSFTVADLHAAVREVDQRVPVGAVSTLREQQLSRNAERHFMMRGVTALGFLALALAAGGLYSVAAYLVSLRQQEVGIRLALGADPGTVVTMIIRQALVPTLIGAAIGAGGAAAAGIVIRSQLFGTAPCDPLAFAGATVLMLVVMAVASWIPAREAGRVDPIQVLRTE